MRARQKRGGEYTSEAAQAVAEKIDSLVEQAEKGTFVPQGRDDILTKAIRTSEHGGRVHGVGRLATLTNYFGRSSSKTQTVNVSEIEAKLEAKMEAKFAIAHEKLQQSFMETIKNMGLLAKTPQTKTETEKVVVIGSTKGSCNAVQQNYKEDSTTYNVQKLLFMFLKEKEHVYIGLQHDPKVDNFWIPPKYIKELLAGTAWLDLTVLQVWCTFIHRLCIETNNSDVFGILDPSNLTFTANNSQSKRQLQSYIQERLRDLKKKCYLAPYVYSWHWQLIIICPNDNLSVVLCSLGKDLHDPMKKIVTKAIVFHQLANGIRKTRVADWLKPNARLQPNGYDCGYYVLKNMSDIVSANITKSWNEVFNDPSALTEDDLYDVRNRWATCFLDLYKV